MVIKAMKLSNKKSSQPATSVTKNGASMGCLMTAALVDPSFRQLLLTDPAAALAGGYNGEKFHLDTKDQDFILSTQATSLLELAEQYVAHQIDNEANGNGSKSNCRS